MIVPRFSIEQNEEFIIVIARTPYIKANEADFYILDTQFKFYCKPYFLRLTFTNSIIENGKEKASYNVDTQQFTFYLPKAVRGQNFTDLDMITKLLDKKKPITQPLIQVEGGSNDNNPDEIDEDEEDYQGDEDYEEELEQDEEWEFEQSIESNQLSVDDIQSKPHYGFNDNFVGFFNDLQDEIVEIIDIPMIEEITKEERTSVRLGFENLAFDEDRYMENHIFPDYINELLHYKGYWEIALEQKKKNKQLKQDNNNKMEDDQPTTSIKLEEPKKVQDFNPSNLEEFDELVNETEFDTETTISSDVINQINSSLTKKVTIEENNNNNSTTTQVTTSSKNKLVTFTDEERDVMKNLPNKEYMIKNEKQLLLGLVDIIFSYAYNVRSTYGEDTIESPWTLCKVSPTLSCLETFSSLQAVVVACMRRSITYPLFRSWKLSLKVLEDVKMIFQLGKRCLLKCLLHIRKCLEAHEFKYYLNRLYIDDYCVWLQYASKKQLKSLRSKLLTLKVEKSETEWPLEAYEKLVEEEGMVFGETDGQEDQEIDEELLDHSSGSDQE